MPLFIVITTETDTQAILKSKIPEHFPEDHYDIGNGIWLVSFDGTAKRLFEQLGEDDEGLYGCFVLRFSSYWGRYEADMWEWISTKMGGGKRA
jgi:hypothetical protein